MSDTSKERVLAVHPGATAHKVNLGMDTVEVTISTTHGEAYGFYMEDVEQKAWNAAAAKLRKEQP